MISPANCRMVQSILLVVAMVGVCTSVRKTSALQQLMMSLSPSRQDIFKKSVAQAASFLPPPPGADTISSNLISQLAVFAIKRRLKEERSVNCEVSFSSSDLLINGRVGPVTVSGKDWCSYRGLTCRAIEATVEQCELDARMIIKSRKLLLTTPAVGKAIVALTATDFGNFITHPLMKSSNSFNENLESTIDFVKEGTVIDPLSSSVWFMVKFQDTTWNCSLQRSTEASKATVQVIPAAGVLNMNDSENELDVNSQSNVLSEKLERFFNEMVFELDGTYLSYRDMMITNKGDIPSVMIALNIKVRKLPSPGMDF